MKNIDISIIIVTYNVKSLLADCLFSIKQSEDNLKKEIFIIDNGRDDTYKLFKDSREYIYIKNKDNVGFSKANNQALKIAKGRYILILNPDTKLNKNTLSEMYNFMEIHKDVGVSTCPLFLPSGELDKACRRSFPTISNSIGKLLNLSKFSDKFKGYNIEGSINREIEIDACTGAFMFIRKEVFSGNKKHTKTAFFDESFWAMGEDLDLCFRIKENNWKIMYTPKTSILHYKGASGGLKKSSSKLSSADKETKRRWIKAYSDAMYIFYKKHYFTQNNVLINFIIIISIKLLYLLQLLKLNVIEK